MQGVVDKLSLEDCEVQVNGIVNHRYNVSREKVVVVDPPKPASEEELRRLRRRIEELETKLYLSQNEARELRAKAKEPKVSVINKQQLDHMKKLLTKVRNENLDTIGALRDKVEDLQRVNRDLVSKLATARREIVSGKAVAFDRQMDAFATIMAAFPFTPTDKLAKEFEVSSIRIIQDAKKCGVEKSTELRAEAKDYLSRQGLKLDDDRGGKR